MNYMAHIHNKIQKKDNKGFTLIEMLVSVGLFSVVMLVSVAAILSIIGNNKKAQGINNVANNLNFAVESMVRDMKTGFLYKCPSSNGNYSSGWPITKATVYESTQDLCTGTGAHDTVAFFSTLDGGATPVEYRFVPPSGQLGNANYVPGYIVKRTGTSPSAPSVELTSKTDVDIQSMKMYITSPAPGTHAQPGIFLIITGKAHILDNQVTDFGLQTFISQRILNL
jgi:prepilin-type N-terminal cleavage/methylation domain-containing protein